MLYAHPGARVLKYAPPIHSIPLWPNQPRTFTSHSIQAQVTPQRSGSGSGSGSGRVVDVRRHGQKKNYINNQVLYTWYQVFRYSSSSSTFHCRCISNSHTRVRIRYHALAVLASSRPFSSTNLRHPRDFTSHTSRRGTLYTWQSIYRYILRIYIQTYNTYTYCYITSIITSEYLIFHLTMCTAWVALLCNPKHDERTEKQGHEKRIAT